jgi:site-specific DNA-methyltransferase (adenine-specific)
MLDINNVYNYDVFDFIDKIDDNSVDLILVDPPYNMNKAKWDTFESEKEFLDFTKKWLEKSIPKLKKSGSYYVFNNPYNSAYILPMMVDLGL